MWRWRFSFKLFQVRAIDDDLELLFLMFTQSYHELNVINIMNCIFESILAALMVNSAAF